VPKPTANEIRKFREQVGKLEKTVAELEAKQAELAAELEEPGTYSTPGRAQNLNRELTGVVDQIATATEEWEKASSKLEEMEKA